MENKVLDLVIVGAGPAGMTAAIYANRAMLDFVILEKAFAGGQITNTYEIENFPGVKSASGFELANMFREHVEHFGVNIISADFQGIEKEDDIYIVKTPKQIYKTKTVILAMGSDYRKLGAPGEEEFAGKGVSYCATCDGAFYRGKTTMIIGGGDVAVEDAIYLSRMCEKVYLVHRRDELRAKKSLQDKLFATENIEVIWDANVKEINGDEFVTDAVLINKHTKEETKMVVDGVFVAIGNIPNTVELKEKAIMDEGGYLEVSDELETSLKGVFAAGDLRQGTLRQVITACGDGATAVFGVEKYV